MTISSADAQSPVSRQIERQAMNLTQRALAHYRAGDLTQALELLEEANELVRQPVIVFNLARLHEARGDLESSVDFYRQYLELSPDAPDQGAVEARIASIERQIEERERLDRAREEAARQAAEEALRAQEAEQRAEVAEGRSVVGPWVLGGLGVAVLGVATVLGAVARSEADGVDPDDDHLTATEAQARADKLALAANIGFATGGALVAVGLTWGLVRRPRSGEDAEAHVVLTVGGRF